MTTHKPIPEDDLRIMEYLLASGISALSEDDWQTWHLVKDNCRALIAEVRRLQQRERDLLGSITNAHGCLLAGTPFPARQILAEALGLDVPTVLKDV